MKIWKGDLSMEYDFLYDYNNAYRPHLNEIGDKYGVVFDDGGTFAYNSYFDDNKFVVAYAETKLGNKVKFWIDCGGGGMITKLGTYFDIQADTMFDGEQITDAWDDIQEGIETGEDYKLGYDDDGNKSYYTLTKEATKPDGSRYTPDFFENVEEYDLLVEDFKELHNRLVKCVEEVNDFIKNHAVKALHKAGIFH